MTEAGAAADAPPPVWVLTDPRAGTAAQALGIAERLEAPFRTVPLEWGPLARLPIPWPSLLGLRDRGRALRGAALERGWARFRSPGPGAVPRVVPEWPALAITAGRRSAPVSRWLRRQGVRTVHCMRPGAAAADFDLLVIGAHDRPAPAPNLVTVMGACHRLSPARLDAARSEWAALGALPGPRVALLVGGPVRGEGMDPADAVQLLARLRRRFPGGTVLATTSRRTGEAAAAVLAAALDATPHRLFRWGGGGPNPYAGFLAWADAVVVTGDSVSMMAEACATGVPVLVATREEGRHLRLAESLMEAGLVAPLRHAARASCASPRARLDESGRVAAIIRDKGWLPA